MQSPNVTTTQDESKPQTYDWDFVNENIEYLKRACSKVNYARRLDQDDFFQEASINLALKAKNYDPTRAGTGTFIYLSVRWVYDKMLVKAGRKVRSAVTVPLVSKEGVVLDVKGSGAMEIERVCFLKQILAQASKTELMAIGAVAQGYRVDEMPYVVGIGRQGVSTRISNFRERVCDGEVDILEAPQAT